MHPVTLALAVTDSWIKACWLDMANHDIYITSDIPDFNLPQAGDSELMLAFLRVGFCTEELAMLNRCWMFCKVISHPIYVWGRGPG